MLARSYFVRSRLSFEIESTAGLSWADSAGSDF
jgi:hypothetical protein